MTGDMERAAKLAGREAALQTLATLGIDTDNPNEMRADFVYLRRWRELIESLYKALIIAVVVGLSGSIGTLIYMGFTATIKAP